VSKRRKEFLKEIEKLSKEGSDKHITKKATDTFVKFSEREEDSTVIKALKKVINESQLKRQTLYDLLGQSKAYNLEYGLKDPKRKNITTSSLDLWLKVLDAELVISVKKEKE